MEFEINDIFADKIKNDSKSNEKPRCFNECHIPGCDMVEDHCGNSDWPPMSKCTRCNFWFPKVERERDERRRQNEKK